MDKLTDTASLGNDEGDNDNESDASVASSVDADNYPFTDLEEEKSIRITRSQKKKPKLVGQSQDILDRPPKYRRKRSRKPPSRQGGLQLEFKAKEVKKMDILQVLDQMILNYKRHEPEHTAWGDSYHNELKQRITDLHQNERQVAAQEQQITSLTTTNHELREKLDSIARNQNEHDTQEQVIFQQERESQENKITEQTQKILELENQIVELAKRLTLVGLQHTEKQVIEIPDDNLLPQNLVEMGILQLSSRLFLRLGSLPQSLTSEDTRKDIQILTQYFQSYTDKVSDLLSSHMDLQKKHSDLIKENNVQALRSRERDNLIERLRTENQTRQEFQETLQTSIKNQLQSLPLAQPTALSPVETPTFPVFQYADVARFPATQPDKPKLRLSLKTKRATTHKEVRKNLISLNSGNSLPVEMVQTRDNRLLLVCQSQSHLQEVEKKLQEMDYIQNNILVEKLGPRKKKILIFGVSEVPAIPPTTSSEVDSNQDMELSEFVENILKPGLNRLLRKQITTASIVRILPSRQSKSLNNIVLQVEENDAVKLIGQKVIIGLQRCQIRDYVTVPRCFKCQRLGHFQSNCMGETRCGFCAGHHETRTCPKTDPPRCINCQQDTNNQGKPNKRNLSNHPASDSNCPSYKMAFKVVLQQSQQKQPTRSFPV